MSSLEEQFPELMKKLKFNHRQAIFSQEKLNHLVFDIDYFVMPTMWIDCMGDSSSYIVGYDNLKQIQHDSYIQATNMESRFTLFERMIEGKECAIAVEGQAAETEQFITIYREHPETIISVDVE